MKKITPEQKAIMERLHLSDNIEKKNNSHFMTTRYEPDKSYLGDAKKLIQLEKDIRRDLWRDTATLWERTKGVYLHYIKKDTTHYPKLSRVLGEKNRKIKEGYGKLEIIVNRINKNNNELRKERRAAIKNIYDADDVVNLYGQKKEKTMNDLLTISEIVKNPEGYDNKTVINALAIENELLFDYADENENFIVGTANMRNNYQQATFLKKLAKVTQVLRLGSRLKLDYYKVLEMTVKSIMSFVDTIPEAVSVILQVEEEYASIQNMLGKYKKVTSALQTLELKQLEHTMGPEIAGQTYNGAQ